MDRSLVDIFWSGMPRAYMENAHRGAIAQCPIVHEDCLLRDGTPWHINTFPIALRASVQRLMVEAASLFPGQVFAEPTLGETTTNNWWFAKAVAGGVILACNSAANPDEVVKFSESRLMYAHNTCKSRQRLLFDDDEDIIPLPNESGDCFLFAQWLIGRHHTVPHELSFSVIRFPNADGTGYFDEVIDLFKEFPGSAYGGGAAGTPSDDDFDDIDLHDQEGLA